MHLLRRYHLYKLRTQRIAISGAPATGKTTISLALEAKGHHVFHEVAREIIQRSLQTGSDVLPWKDVIAFSELVWSERRAHFSEALLGTISFYDRTIIDSVAYLDKDALPLKAEWEHDCEEMRYDKVFILPVWPEIFEKDEERMETLEDCYEVDEFIRKAYTRLGYEIIEVPTLTVEERVAFIEDHI